MLDSPGEITGVIRPTAHSGKVPCGKLTCFFTLILAFLDLVGDPFLSGIVLKTSNGSIRGTIHGSPEDWAIDSGTSNGRNSLPKQQPGRKALYVHTSNGSIQVGFEG